jgi:two-component system, chemotaxis family, sensor kinase Cph1
MNASDGVEPLLAVGVPVDLDNCEREPIHIPGSIQPRGTLIAVEEMGLAVTQVSGNLGRSIGVNVDAALGRPLSEVLGGEGSAAIERAISAFGDLRERNPVEVTIDVSGEHVAFDAILHRASDGVLVIELEPARGPRPFSFPNTYLAVRGAVANLNQAVDLAELYRITARAVRDLTGFDRVMVYRYDHEFNGEVVAEEKRQELDSFLGLHYPASDIPAQARALYEKNWIRLISDVDYQPNLLVPNLNPLSSEPLDLTYSTLRSVSPIHIEYLHNMGVRASMSISLLRHGTLWGLIACHHYSGPHSPPYGVRAAAEFLGSTLSLRLVNRAERDELGVALQAQSVLAKLTAAISDEGQPMAVSLFEAPGLIDLFPADGIAVSIEGGVATRGVLPDPVTVEAIAQWARSTGDELVVTDCLTRSAPDIEISATQASGVLALQLPERQYILWFRTEAPRAIDWGGNPNEKSMQPDESDAVRLSPRKSFDRWQEVVHLRSLPWTPEQVKLALDVRTHAVEQLYVRSGRELREAEILQRSLLPTVLPSVQNWSISAYYEPAEGVQIGGDWYDVIVLSDDTVAVVLGDVAGHGIGAAGIMAQLRNALRAYLLETVSPGQALHRLNQFAASLLPDAFATAFVACVHTATGTVVAASAGHLKPYLIVPGTRAGVAPVRTSPPLGVTGAEYDESEFMIGRGAALILFSDGLVERRAEDITIGLERLGGRLTPLAPDTGAAEISAAVTTSGAHDDTTVVAVHRH